MEETRTNKWAIIGATGRLGRSLCRALGHERVRGMARQAPAESQSFERFVAADRRDPGALSDLMQGADLIVDLCAQDASDAAPLIEAMLGCQSPPRRLIFASSLAERAVTRWVEPEADMGADPPLEDEYGLGKRAARLAYQSQLSVPVLTLLLPQLLSEDDPDARERRYLDDARSLGMALLPGTGRQHPALATTAGVADAIVALAAHPGAADEVLHLVPPTGPDVITLVEALLTGAGLPTAWQRHDDSTWRGPHSGADERVNDGRFRELLPGFEWPDPRAAMAALGAFLAASSPH